MGLDEELYLRKLELDNERFRGVHKRPHTKRTAPKVRSRPRKRPNGLYGVLLLVVACGLGWGVYEAGNRFNATASAPKKAVTVAPGPARSPKKPVVRSATPLVRRTIPLEPPIFSEPLPSRPMSLAGALHRAIASAVQGDSLGQPSCGAPTGTLSVSATNRYSMGQWAVEVILAGSSLR